MWEINATTVAAFIVGVIAVSRLTRLIVDDDWPPMVWLRGAYLRALASLFHADQGDQQARRATSWYHLVECPFCVAPWLALGSLGWAWGSGLAWHWWVFHLWLAAAYLAAILNVRDIPQDAREG